MSRPKEIENEVRLSVVLFKKQAERIKHMALRMSTQEERQITVSKAVRMALKPSIRCRKIKPTYSIKRCAF